MIRINNSYLIKSDGIGYTLLNDMHVVDKKGNPVYKTLGYYGDLKQALNGYARKRVLCESLESEFALRDVKALLTEIENEIKKVVV